MKRELGWISLPGARRMTTRKPRLVAAANGNLKRRVASLPLSCALASKPARLPHPRSATAFGAESPPKPR